jgi:hypothetical protein
MSFLLGISHRKELCCIETNEPFFRWPQPALLSLFCRAELYAQSFPFISSLSNGILLKRGQQSRYFYLQSLVEIHSKITLVR